MYILFSYNSEIIEFELCPLAEDHRFQVDSSHAYVNLANLKFSYIFYPHNIRNLTNSIPNACALTGIVMKK